jgi:hypothetical protein
MKFRILSATLALAFMHQAEAALVDQGLTTLDTSTQLVWMDLTQTSGYTFNEVSSQFGVGGKFEGYRYASAAEVQGIFSQFGIPLVAPTEYNGKSAVPVASALVAFETLFDVYPTSFFDALVADTVPGDPNSHQLFYGSGTGQGVDPLSASASIFTSFPTDPATYKYNVYEDQYTIALGADEKPLYSNSSFIVKLEPSVVASIPEPGTSALMLLGLGALAVAARRRTR